MIKRFITLILSVLMCFMTVFTVSGCASGNEFTVTFDPNGGERVGGGELVQTVTSASEIEEPELEKEGYLFIGWDEVLAEINSDTTVKALWEKEKITVRFVVSGGNKVEGSGDDVQEVATANDIQIPKYVREGYDLVWDTDISAITENCIVTGTWVARKYILSFRDKEGNAISGIEDMQVTFEQPIGTLVIGMEFSDKKIVGWKIGSDNLSSGQAWKYASDKTAVPILGNLNGDFYIEYDLDGGEHNGNPTYYRESDNAITINDPTKTGHTFLGWQEKDEDGNNIGTPVKGLIIPADAIGDKHYVAIWEAKTYNVTLVIGQGSFVDGEEVREIDVTISYGATVEFPKVFGAAIEYPIWQHENGKIWNGMTWDLDDALNYSLTAVFGYRYKFNFDMSCVVRGANVISTLNNPNDALNFIRAEGVKLGTLPTYKPNDTEEYSASYWKFEKNGEYVKVDANTLVNAETFVGYVDDNSDGIIEVTLYAWCRPNWTPAY